MNKKILPIFVMVMALSLLGVSCNNKSTDPTQTDNRPSIELTLGTAGIDSAPFSIKAKKDLSSAAATGTAASITAVKPDIIDTKKLTATAVSMNLQNNTTDNIQTPFTLDEFALDFSTADKVDLKVGGQTHSNRGSGTFTSDVTGTVKFKISAEGFKDSYLTVYVTLEAAAS